MFIPKTVKKAVLKSVTNALAEQIQSIPGRINCLIIDTFTTVISINSADPAFAWLKIWLADHPYTKKARTLEAVSRDMLSVGASLEEELLEEPNKDTRPRIVLIPDVGEHWVRFQGHLVKICRYEENAADGNSNSSSSNVSQGDKITATKKNLNSETFTLRVLGDNREIIMNLLEAARDKALPPDIPKLNVYTSRYSYWTRSARARIRPLDSVILHEGVKEEIVADIQEFLNTAEWYMKTGIPYRRGYLLYGPPGNGKSSLVQALAGHFGRSIYTLSLSSELCDEDLQYLLTNVPLGGIVLLEDVDCAFNKREKDDDAPDKVTFSGLLNAIDGVGASEGRLLFMTTNHPNRLDKALVRRGRADKKMLIDNANEEQARRLFLRFFENETELAEEFSSKVGPTTSMADLQDILLMNKDDAVGAAEGRNDVE